MVKFSFQDEASDSEVKVKLGNFTLPHLLAKINYCSSFIRRVALSVHNEKMVPAALSIKIVATNNDEDPWTIHLPGLLGATSLMTVILLSIPYSHPSIPPVNLPIQQWKESL